MTLLVYQNTGVWQYTYNKNKLGAWQLRYTITETHDSTRVLKLRCMTVHTYHNFKRTMHRTCTHNQCNLTMQLTRLLTMSRGGMHVPLVGWFFLTIRGNWEEFHLELVAATTKVMNRNRCSTGVHAQETPPTASMYNHSQRCHHCYCPWRSGLTTHSTLI